ncbi:MAG TPA: AraC family transcriptional regulator [Flavobacteriales bacterium]
MSDIQPQPFRLTDIDKMRTLVEHKTSYSLNNCQLNVYETHQKASDFRLAFEGITITSMLRGKKVMRIPHHEEFDYLPGETVIVPSGTELNIDFPEAARMSPTQCTALVLENEYFQKQIDYINEQSAAATNGTVLKVDLKHLLIRNAEELTTIIHRVYRTLSSDDVLKDAQADVLMKELILSLIRSQNLSALQHNGHYEGSPFKAILNYIRSNITSTLEIAELCKVAYMSKSSFYRAFTNEFGISPNQLIIRERLRMSKAMMLLEGTNVKDVCYAVGFADPNYFIRLFKKHEGITPGQFIKQHELQ